jgi:hypothetical protein
MLKVTEIALTVLLLSFFAWAVLLDILSCLFCVVLLDVWIMIKQLM